MTETEGEPDLSPLLTLTHSITCSLKRRAKKEGKDSSQYERKYYFHGTNPTVNELIYQQGFNRSFAGKKCVAPSCAYAC